MWSQNSTTAKNATVFVSDGVETYHWVGKPIRSLRQVPTLFAEGYDFGDFDGKVECLAQMPSGELRFAIRPKK